jgi:hypothetical protein
MDHGYEVDMNKRCRAISKKERQCAQFAVKGIDLCALHSGLAKAKGASGFGDVRALEAYKQRLLAGPATRAPGR